MAIFIIEGLLVCNICNKLIQKKDFYKLNEVQLEVACSKCDSESDFSYSIVSIYTNLKDVVFKKIKLSIDNNKTSVIDKIFIFNKYTFEDILNPRFKENMTDLERIHLIKKIIKIKIDNIQPDQSN